MTKEDPRLERPLEWDRIEKEVNGDYPTLYDFFQYKKTRQIINYDLRLELDKLEANGGVLNWFS